MASYQDPKLRTRSRSGSAATSVGSKTPAAPTPLAAAAQAANKHSLNGPLKNSGDLKLATAPKVIGGVKAANPKVEEAKRRILANRPGSKRAKEIYELSKTRARIDSNDLAAIGDPTDVRRSSFEKVDKDDGEVKMTKLSLRDNDMDTAGYESRKYVTTRGFKSRFADDGSDTDLPLPPLNTHIDSSAAYKMEIVPGKTTDTQSKQVVTKPEKSKSGFKFGLLNKKKSKSEVAPSSQPRASYDPQHVNTLADQVIHENTQRKSFGFHHGHKENSNSSAHPSKFDKFFLEQHGPSGRRITSDASAITNNTVNTASTDTKKKSRLRKLFGSNN